MKNGIKRPFQNNMMVTSSQPQTLNFPVPKNINLANWMLGHGFDPVNGTVLDAQGFSPINPIISSTPTTEASFQYDFVSDTDSFKSSLDYVESAHGKGWGASVNEEVSAQFMSSYNSQEVSVYYYASAHARNEAIDKTTQKLSDTARRILQDEGYEAFCDRYGTHFVSGIIYDSGCYLTYHLKFLTVAAQTAFSSSFSESYKGFGVSESMSEQITAAAEASGTSHTESITQTYYGFIAEHAFNTVDDIAPIEEEYKASLNNEESDHKAEIVQVSVSSWDSLDEVYDLLHASDTAIPSALSVNSDLGMIYKEISFSYQSARSFIDNKHFAGHYQFQQVNALRETCSSLIQEIMDLVDNVKNGEDITSAMISDYFEQSAILSDNLQSVTKTFAVSWYYTFEEESHPVNVLKNIDGTTPIAAYNNDLNSWGIGGTTLINWPEGNTIADSIPLFDHLVVGKGPIYPYINNYGDDNGDMALSAFNMKLGVSYEDRIKVGGSMNSTEVNDLTQSSQYAEACHLRIMVI